MLALHFINIVEGNLVSVLDQIDSIKKAAEVITSVVLSKKNVFVVEKYEIIDNESLICELI